MLCVFLVFRVIFFFSLFCFLGLCMFQTLDTNNLLECIAGKGFFLFHGLSLRSTPFVDCGHNAYAAGVLFEKSLPVPAHWNILPTFFSDSFRVSSLMLRWFCAGDRWRSSFFLLKLDTQDSQHCHDLHSFGTDLVGQWGGDGETTDLLQKRRCLENWSHQSRFGSCVM